MNQPLRLALASDTLHPQVNGVARTLAGRCREAVRRGHPSVTDTFGNVLLEAMASGLAIVAADSAPTRSLISLALPRFYRATDTRELVRQIAFFAGSPSARLRSASLGVREAQQRSWGVVFDTLFATYGSPVRAPWPRHREQRPAA